MAKAKKGAAKAGDEASGPLWPEADLPPLETPEPLVRRPDRPIWTDNKAKLIERYLYYFVLITHHGTYIDGFAGPQEPDRPDMWAANLVLSNEPRWLRHFHLFDAGRQQVQRLKELKAAQPSHDSKGHPLKRDIQIVQGDFNKSLPNLLASGSISQKEATFCLLDQCTFECEWETLRRLAAYKEPGNNKIELFYFLAIGWLGRALAAQQDLEKLERWWGRGDYDSFRLMSNADRERAFRLRFKQELGYKSVKSWPIYEHQSGRRIMYYMIHATDHPEGPIQMSRAYANAVKPKESHDQLAMELGLPVADDEE